MMNLFQKHVSHWIAIMFGQEKTPEERALRFLEEALELVQATGAVSEETAHSMVGYVYSRPVGDLTQEMGGTMVTLGALGNWYGIDMMEEAESEIDRCFEPRNMASIRAKQRNKPDHLCGPRYNEPIRSVH